MRYTVRMQTNPNINTGDTQQKTPFWHNKERRIIFLTGAGIVAVATIFALILSGWKDAPVVIIKQNSSYSCTKSSERSYTYIYEVDGKRYDTTACAPTPLSTVAYYPGDPSIALTNAVVIYKVIAIVFGALGVIVMLGAIFAANTKQPKNSVGLNIQTPPTQVSESILPTDQSVDPPSEQKQIARKIIVSSIVATAIAGALSSSFPSDTIFATIANIVNALALCALLVSAIILNNILRRERKDAGNVGESQPLTIEEINVRIVLGVAIGLAIIVAAIFALSYFYRNS